MVITPPINDAWVPHAEVLIGNNQAGWLKPCFGILLFVATWWLEEMAQSWGFRWPSHGGSQQVTRTGRFGGITP